MNAHVSGPATYTANIVVSPTSYLRTAGMPMHIFAAVSSCTVTSKNAKWRFARERSQQFTLFPEGFRAERETFQEG